MCFFSLKTVLSKIKPLNSKKGRQMTLDGKYRKNVFDKNKTKYFFSFSFSVPLSLFSFLSSSSLFALCPPFFFFLFLYRFTVFYFLTLSFFLFLLISDFVLFSIIHSFFIFRNFFLFSFTVFSLPFSLFLSLSLRQSSFVRNHSLMKWTTTKGSNVTRRY